MEWTRFEEATENSLSIHAVSVDECSSEGLEVLQLKSADLLGVEEITFGDIESPASPQTEIPRLLEDNFSIEVQELWLQLLYQLLKVGGWTAAVLLAFRLVVVPILGAGSSPAALVLAVAAGVFLVLCGVGAIIHELRQ